MGKEYYIALRRNGGWELLRFVGVGEPVSSIGRPQDWRPFLWSCNYGRVRQEAAERGGKIIHTKA